MLPQPIQGCKPEKPLKSAVLTDSICTLCACRTSNLIPVCAITRLRFIAILAPVFFAVFRKWVEVVNLRLASNRQAEAYYGLSGWIKEFVASPGRRPLQITKDQSIVRPTRGLLRIAPCIFRRFVTRLAGCLLCMVGAEATADELSLRTGAIEVPELHRHSGTIAFEYRHDLAGPFAFSAGYIN